MSQCVDVLHHLEQEHNDAHHVECCGHEVGHDCKRLFYVLYCCVTAFICVNTACSLYCVPNLVHYSIVTPRYQILGFKHSC